MQSSATKNSNFKIQIHLQLFNNAKYTKHRSHQCTLFIISKTENQHIETIFSQETEKLLLPQAKKNT